MKHQPIDPAAPHDGASSTDIAEALAPPGQRHDGWTPARQAGFLRELAATHCVSTAARAVGMSRQSAYKLRNRLKGEPFDIAWHAAFRLQYDALLEAAVERAINGVEVPHFHKGELIHTSRRYDERATVALLALRARLEPEVRCYRADDEGIYPGDFDLMVARVEHGDELWAEVDYADPDEDG
ncbi:MAG TPA: hypothetical protein VEB68_03040 [Croceibacterium sp.]|nr:hypothetical protein [Croceibacterium sp.]